MFAEVPIVIAVTREGVEFDFAEPVSMFMLVVSRDSNVVWELVADEGNMVGDEAVSVAPIQADPELPEVVRYGEVQFLSRALDGLPLTTPISLVRYGVIPRGYRESLPAEQLIPGRYSIMAVSAQGRASGEFDVLTA